MGQGDDRVAADPAAHPRGALTRRPPVVALLAAGALLAGCGSAHRSGPPRIVLHASSPLADAPVAVDVDGLQPHQHATLRAAWRAFDGVYWLSGTALRADGAGRIRLRGLDGMRFLWQMTPAKPSRSERVFFPPARGPSLVRLSVAAGGTTTTATLSRRVTPASVRVRRLSLVRDGVDGALFSPAGRARRPGVLVFGGSEGGVSLVDVAGLLAAHGYPTLVMAYFKAPGLPRRLQRVPLESFARAARLLRRQPAVDPARVVPLGASYGGEAALLIAATFPRLFHGAIGLVPSGSVTSIYRGVPSWTLRGRGLPDGPIPVKRIDGPILTAGAGLDDVWDSDIYVREIAQRRAVHHVRFHDTTLHYAQAGHDVGAAVPYLPQTLDQAHFGGTPRGSAAAKADLWPRILRYLRTLPSR